MSEAEAASTETPVAEKKFTIRTRKVMKNPLLQRRQMLVDVIHPGLPTISHDEVHKQIATIYKIADPKTIITYGMQTVFGGGRTTGFCLIYDNLDVAMKYEPKYRLAREGLCKIQKSSRKQRKEKKNKAKKFRGKNKAKSAATASTTAKKKK